MHCLALAINALLHRRVAIAGCFALLVICPDVLIAAVGRLTGPHDTIGTVIGVVLVSIVAVFGRVLHAEWPEQGVDITIATGRCSTAAPATAGDVVIAIAG